MLDHRSERVSLDRDNPRHGSVSDLWEGGTGGVLIVTHGRSRMTIALASLKCPDGERPVSTDQTHIACTKREALSGVRRVACVKGELHSSN